MAYEFPRIGSVDASGTIRFASGNRLACQQFLRGLGLSIENGSWQKPGWLGEIEFRRGKWHSTARRNADAVKGSDSLPSRLYRTGAALWLA